MMKGKRGHIKGLSNFWVPPIISGTGEATQLKFGWNRVHQIKSPLKISVKGDRGHIEGLHKELPKFFRALIYRAHRAVMFAIAQLSCIT